MNPLAQYIFNFAVVVFAFTVTFALYRIAGYLAEMRDELRTIARRVPVHPEAAEAEARRQAMTNAQREAMIAQGVIQP